MFWSTYRMFLFSASRLFFFSDLMPSFIRHPTFLRREPPLVEPVPAGVSGAGPYSSSSVGDVSGPKSFLRNAPPRTPLEISRRESHRLSAPPHLHRDYSPSSPSYISDAGSVTENGDGGPYYYPPEPYYNNQPRRAHRQDHFNESYRYYEHNELNYPRNPGQPQTPQPHSRPPPGEEHIILCAFTLTCIIIDSSWNNKHDCRSLL